MELSLRFILRSVLLFLIVVAIDAQFQRQFNQFKQSQNFFVKNDAFAQNNNQRYQEEQAARNFGSNDCPEPNGRFPVATQCDAYVECIDGVPEQKLCPEGLLFNPDARFNYPCGYPIDVKCLTRTSLQPAQPTEDCPHQYGYFKMGDRQSCGQFMNCVEGRAYVFNCPEGLAYNPDSYRCDWPDQVADCDAEAYLGFTCPSSVQNSIFNTETKFYKSPNDCQRYYICVNGRPRLQNCGEGHAFNELVGTCDAAENVTGCEPPQSSSENFQQPLDQSRQLQNTRSFIQQTTSFNEKKKIFNQPRNFESFQNSQNFKNAEQSNNQFAKQRFASAF